MIGKDASILYRTGQIWKFRVMYLFTLLGIALVIGAQWFKDSGSWFVGMDIAGCLAILVGLAFPMLAVKCPECRARWYWMAVSKKHDTHAFRWLASQAACPACGAQAAKIGENP